MNVKKLKVLIKRVGKPCEVAEIDDTLEEKQKIVGGRIEIVPFDDDGNILIICNEEGKLMGLNPNIIFTDYDILRGDYIAGDFIIVADNFDGSFRDLVDEEITLIGDMINKRAFRG